MFSKNQKVTVINNNDGMVKEVSKVVSAAKNIVIQGKTGVAGKRIKARQFSFVNRGGFFFGIGDTQESCIREYQEGDEQKVIEANEKRAAKRASFSAQQNGRVQERASKS